MLTKPDLIPKTARSTVSRTRTTRLLVAVLALPLVLLTGCASDTAGPGSAGTAEEGPGGDCPVTPIDVVVSVDQWRDLTRSLAGRCARVTTVVTGTSVDPHDYEPSPSDLAAFAGARLVVVNGLGYDSWALAAAEGVDPRPAVVNAGVAAGERDGNPHLWYSPTAVEAAAGAVTGELRRLLPGAEAYLDERAAAWRTEVTRWTSLIAAVRSRHGGRPYAATEPVIEPLAEALGLVDATPEGYRNATANESEPSPADLAAFEDTLRQRRAAVLVFNTQTEGPLADQLRGAADGAGIPVVEVTETVAAPEGRDPAQPEFVAWQVDQLRRLDTALAAGPGGEGR
jgi:zinc/manganese transport system substrate-binding protein